MLPLRHAHVYEKCCAEINAISEACSREGEVLCWFQLRHRHQVLPDIIRAPLRFGVVLRRETTFDFSQVTRQHHD
jgi:hypothetical protein